MSSLTPQVFSKRLALQLMSAKKLVFPLMFIAGIAFKLFSLSIHLEFHHDEDEEHHEPCELCEQAEFVSGAFFNSADAVSVPEIAHVICPQRLPVLQGHLLENGKVLPYYFCRPPPTV